MLYFLLHFAIPLITVVLGIYLKFVTRNDLHTSFVKEDLAFGLEISITALILFITGTVNYSTKLGTTIDPKLKLQIEERLVTVPWLLLAFFLGIWGISTLVRKIGWRDESQLKVFCGIIIPDLFGIGVLILVVNWIG